MDRLEAGIKLLADWESFTQRDPSQNLAQFGAWLQEEYDESQANALDRALAEAPAEVAGSPNLLDAQISFTWGRLMRFTQIWAKRAFADTPIRTMEELGTLMYIFQQGSPRKSEVANHSLMEQTTCFEIIKRLQRQHLVEEFPDPEDRRSRRVQLSPDARELVGSLLRSRAETLSTLLLGKLSKDEKLVLWNLLRSLDTFHGETLMAHPESSVEAIVNERLS